MLAGSAMFGPYKPPASLRSASPFCSAKRGGFASPIGPPRSMAGVPPLHFPGHTPLASFAPLSSLKGVFVLRPRSREKGIPRRLLREMAGESFQLGLLCGLYEPPASLRSVSPFCSAKRGWIRRRSASPGVPRSVVGSLCLGYLPRVSYVVGRGQ